MMKRLLPCLLVCACKTAAAPQATSAAQTKSSTPAAAPITPGAEAPPVAPVLTAAPVATAPSRWPEIERRAASMVQPAPSVGLAKIKEEFDSQHYSTITEPYKARLVAWARTNGGLPTPSTRPLVANEKLMLWYVSAMAYAEFGKDSRMPRALDYFAYRLRTEGAHIDETRAGFSIAAQLVWKGHRLAHPPTTAELQRALALYALNLRDKLASSAEQCTDASACAELLQFAETFALDAPTTPAALLDFRDAEIAKVTSASLPLRKVVLDDKVMFKTLMMQYALSLGLDMP